MIFTFLQKQIAFTYSWRKKLQIALIISIMLAFIQIFLQPFDTYQSAADDKNLKLAGYSLCLFFPIILMHSAERWWYQRRGKSWRIVDEIINTTVMLLFIITLAYLYHGWAFNASKISFGMGLGFAIHFGVPFIPVIVLPLVYLRIKLGIKKETKASIFQEPYIAIQGENNDEELQLQFDQFIYAQAQQNYVAIFYLDDENTLQEKLLRATLSSIHQQLADAQKTHRSYIINPQYITEIQGNARKRFVHLSHVKEPIPLSNTYYDSLQKALQN